ncbi:MAG: hypothetical protein DRJ52_04815 [Thermoprotei archaeon]|nr:MAG: hypothetical protein DRJ52_04815 [Thermoprotei archaeon]
MIYLVESSRGVTAPIFNINNPASTGGRIDVIFRSLMAAMPNDLEKRKLINFYVVLSGPPSPPLLVKFIGKEFKEQLTSEVSVGRLFLRILKKEEVNGVYSKKINFSRLLRTLINENYYMILLDEKGVDILSIKRQILRKFPKIVFVLGDHDGLSPEAFRELNKMRVLKVSIGPRVYLTSHCIAYMNFVLSKWGLL